MSAATLLVDGGGTTTRAALCAAGALTPCIELLGDSANPNSVGRDGALENIVELVHRVWRARPPGTVRLDATWLCLSTVSSRAALDDLAARLLAVDPFVDADEVWIANDVLPLLVHDGRVVDRVAVNCGTGTGFCGVNTTTMCSARVSGREYLLADEGGGFDLGLQGLRAVVRADDGRGPATALTAMLPSWRTVRVDDLVDVVHSCGEPKAVVASFAPFVLEAAGNGDVCAVAIVEAAAQELVTGVRAVADRIRLPEAFEVVVSGSNLVGRCPALRERFADLLGRALPHVSSCTVDGSTLVPVARMAQLVDGDVALQALLAGCLPLARFEPRANVAWTRLGRRLS